MHPFISTLVTCATLLYGERLLANTSSTNPLRNDLTGSLSGQVDFAQTHVVAATRRLFDPFLVPEREALVMFEPKGILTEGVTLMVELDGDRREFAMTPPTGLPLPAKFDVENTFSGKVIEGDWPSYRTNTFSYRLPWHMFVARARLSFRERGGRGRAGILGSDHFVFMRPESEGLVLMNIEGCVLKEEARCNLDSAQLDLVHQPLLSKMAAREMFSELPVKRLQLGIGRAYWPKIIAIGPDHKPHVYDANNAKEWAAFGDKTLPAKVGMGNYWRAASDLGDKAEGRYVAISGQMLDVPKGIPVLPPGVGASCGGSSCNYPNYLAGYWHETGHGFGLPHDTPGRYEDWAYRSYDNKFLPNTHPDPAKYGLPVDQFGLHYFGHVMGTSEGGSWPTRTTASAPLIDEFEALRKSGRDNTSAWRLYIAPYTHQQMLRIQQRFGHFPPGIPYAGLEDDYREEPAPGLKAQARLETKPTIAIGVPVHTLVATFSDPSHNDDGINQIYPPIVSNYGNVFAPQYVSTFPGEPRIPHRQAHALQNDSNFRLIDANGHCITKSGMSITSDDCKSPQSYWQIKTLSPHPDEASMLPVLALAANDGSCLTNTLNFVACGNFESSNVRWRGRSDMTENNAILRLQEGPSGRFITPESNNTYSLKSNEGTGQNIYPIALGSSLPIHEYVMEIQYQGGAPEIRSLFKGVLVKDQLITRAINVASERRPTKAILWVDGSVVFTRDLAQEEALPPVIKVGAEFGYPQLSEHIN